MNRSSLDTLIEMATERRDTAAVALGKLLSQHGADKAQLEALERFRAEYTKRLAHAMRIGLPVHELENEQRFIDAIGDAIRRQEQALAQLATRVAGGRANWSHEERRLKSFTTLSDRADAADAHRELKREQRVTDEFASRLMLHVRG